MTPKWGLPEKSHRRFFLNEECDQIKQLQEIEEVLELLKEISPECSLEGLMLKLKLQYFGCLMRRADSLEKTLILGKIEGGRRRG